MLDAHGHYIHFIMDLLILETVFQVLFGSKLQLVKLFQFHVFNSRIKFRSKQAQCMKTVKFVFYFLGYRIELQCQPYHPHKKYLYNPFHLHLLQ